MRAQITQYLAFPSPPKEFGTSSGRHLKKGKNNKKKGLGYVCNIH